MIGLFLLKRKPDDPGPTMAAARDLLSGRAAAEAPTTQPPAGETPPPPPGGPWTESAASVSIRDRYDLALGVGFTPDEAVTMAAISLRECRSCSMRSVNASGDVSLWQINRIHWSSTGGPDVLVDPRMSARAARMVWLGAGGGERGFRQWCTYPYGCGLSPGQGGNPTPAEFAQTVAEVRRGIA